MAGEGDEKAGIQEILAVGGVFRLHPPVGPLGAKKA